MLEHITIKKGALNPVNSDFEYQAKLLAAFCMGEVRQGEMDKRPLHAVNAAAAFEAKDYALALRKLRYDAEHGDAAAPYRLYSLYQKGDVIEKNVNEAGKWLRLAAERGSGDAQFWLGVNLLDAKEGFAANKSEAFTWMTRAADKRAADSLFWLGHMYQYGYGTARDLDLAEKYFKLADADGRADAKEKLAEVQKARAGRN